MLELRFINIFRLGSSKFPGKIRAGQAQGGEWEMSMFTLYRDLNSSGISFGSLVLIPWFVYINLDSELS